MILISLSIREYFCIDIIIAEWYNYEEVLEMNDREEIATTEVAKSKFKTIIEKADWFFHTDYYIALLAVLTFVGWVTGLWVPFMFVMLALTIVMFAICKDTTPLFAFMWFFLSTMSTGQYELEGYGWMLFLTIPLVGAIVFNLIRTKPKLKEVLSFGKIKRSTLSVVLLIIPMCLGGLFYPTRHAAAALITAALFITLAFAFVYYMALSKTVIRDKDAVIRYIIKLMFALGLIIVAEVLVSSIRTGSYQAFVAMVTSERINLGWASANPLAAGIILSAPAEFYYMLKKKRFAFVFLIITVVKYFCIIITGSRGSLLILTAAIPFMAAYIFVKTENKLQIYITSGVLLAVLGVTAGIFFDEVKTLLSVFIEQGVSSNGRLIHYKDGWDLFINYPIFGAGWDYGIGDRHVDFSPYLFHSTAVQIIACSGIVGVVAYLYFYYSRYTTFLMRRTKETLTLLFGMLIFEAYGMVDPVFFIPPIYFIMLLTMSFAAEQAMPDDYGRPLLFKKIIKMKQVESGRPL